MAIKDRIGFKVFSISAGYEWAFASTLSCIQNLKRKAKIEMCRYIVENCWEKQLLERSGRCSKTRLLPSGIFNELSCLLLSLLLFSKLA